MAYYSYYQNSQPTWGTSQYSYAAPPAPQFQPQPSWRGVDYYRAHAGDRIDDNIFDYVLFKMKNWVVGTGVGRNEAHHWWKRVYSGLVDPAALLARDLGAAAGYEAIRCWEHHQSIYARPLSEDRAREKEALIGLATAEAARLWPYTGRPLDKWGRLEASEVAAATAARIFAQSYDYDSPYEPYERFPRDRRRSITGTSYGKTRGLSHRSTSFYGRGRPSIDDTSMPYGRTAFPATYSTTATAGAGSAVGLSSSVVSPYSGYGGYGGYGGYDSPVMYPSPSGHSPYSGAYSPYGSGTRMLGGYAGATPYNSPYPGSSVGLPPPPGGGGTYLSVPSTSTHRHRRARSFGAYGAGAARPWFG